MQARCVPGIMRCCRNTSDSGKTVYNRIAPRAAARRICSARADDSRERGEKPALCCGFLSRPKPLTRRGKWDMLAIAETCGYVPESPAPSVKPRSPQRGAPRPGYSERRPDVVGSALRETRIRRGSRWNGRSFRAGDGGTIHRRQHIAVSRKRQSKGGAA